ncbi:MAG: NFACT family protein [Sulfuricurvum sp.]|jgi:predicted ribosome quality control (RQC) complex YloA/Tae2 family protein|uniref:NFACT family protein n=1 Tax=Sulfuricurvum sp. TaxID=2025608 RepID=UPI0025F8176F|nr:NFACT family protein [Sulfuricurvum sp.]MCK9371892.1 NFACT family protein [Sulfuricurvum sp.]
MQPFNQINAAYRLSDTCIRIVFDHNRSMNFEMRRADATIYLDDSASRGKMYQAPFDVLLAKRLNRSTIQSITLHNRDKIIRILTTTSGAYKSESTMIQFEFTGKHTNVILLDKEEYVLEALRHIDGEFSTRSVRVGQLLIDPPPPPYTPKPYPIEDVESFLREEYRRCAGEKLGRLKHEKTLLLRKRLEQLQRNRGSLEDEASLMAESERSRHFGHLILANLDRIKPYERGVDIADFDGTLLHITLPEGCLSAAMTAEHFFKRSKKLKQKGVGVYKERHNLDEKIRYIELFIQTVQEAATPEDIALLFPQKTAGAKNKGSDLIAEFWIEGVKVSLGKSEKGNIELLRNAKSRDIWMHLKDRPSAHLIITTDKQQLPQKLIEAAAKLCVDFSVFEKGRYLVDYTPRREVKIVEGANVLYTNYKTMSVEKTGLS